VVVADLIIFFDHKGITLATNGHLSVKSRSRENQAEEDVALRLVKQHKHLVRCRRWNQTPPARHWYKGPETAAQATG
jgi:hypothetical protein